MIRVAIVDDEKKERDILYAYYEKLQTEMGERFEIDTFSSGEELLNTADKVYDILCLDIEMEGRNGIDTAKEIRKFDENVIILFITNMAQMAIRGYEVQAFDFILKPMQYYNFAIKIQNAVNIVNARKNRNIVITTTEGVHRISTNQLTYAEVSGHYLYFHTTSGEVYKQKASLSDLERKLTGLPFWRCNQCYLVNLEFVDSLAKDEVKVGDDWLKISRPRKKEFLQALTNYMGGIRL